MPRCATGSMYVSAVGCDFFAQRLVPDLEPARVGARLNTASAVAAAPNRAWKKEEFGKVSSFPFGIGARKGSHNQYSDFSSRSTSAAVCFSTHN